MSDHGYGPHSNDADCALLYTQAQMDAMVARAISAERERWKSRVENASLLIEHLQAQVKELIDSIVDGRAFLPSPPITLQWDVEKVRAETERCAKVVIAHPAAEPHELAELIRGGK